MMNLPPNIEIKSLSAAQPEHDIEPLPLQSLPEFRLSLDHFAQNLATKPSASRRIDFNTVPFVIDSQLDAATLADKITHFFYAIRHEEGAVLSLLWQQFTAFARPNPALEALLLAGERIAADYDRGRGHNQQNAHYHRLYSIEILVCAHVLALLHNHHHTPLTEEAQALLLLAALVCIWNHDGGTNTAAAPFRLADRAYALAAPYMQDLSPVQQETLRSMVYSIHDPAHQHMAATPLGLMLRDAVLLPMAGLTADYAAVMTSRLRDEQARPFAQAEYLDFLKPFLLPAPKADPQDFTFASQAGQFFNANLPVVVQGHAQMMYDMGEDVPPESDDIPEDDWGIDLSIFDAARTTALDFGTPTPNRVEHILALRQTLKNAGYFDAPPFMLELRNLQNLLPLSPQDEAFKPLHLAEAAADTMQRLHTVSGPVLSAIVWHLFESIGLKVDDPVYSAAMLIARQIDDGHGAGTMDDVLGAPTNPYHNHIHILDLLLLCDFMGQKSTERSALASSPLARGLLLLAALICHWHHTGRGNSVHGVYQPFYLQDRALAFAAPALLEMPRALYQSLETLVRATDPRDPYGFTQAAYWYHKGRAKRPDVPPTCDPLARLLGDADLCTLAARLNDAILAPFVGLGTAFGARSLVRFGLETGAPLDFSFIRKNLIARLLTRPLAADENCAESLKIGAYRIASFTTDEAQDLFNPALHHFLTAAV